MSQTTKPLKPLIPPDRNRCQAESRSFMTLGSGFHRCTNKPVFIAIENQPGEDGRVGKMSLCMKCAEKMIEKHGASYARLIIIDSKRRGRR